MEEFPSHLEYTGIYRYVMKNRFGVYVELLSHFHV